MLKLRNIFAVMLVCALTAACGQPEDPGTPPGEVPGDTVTKTAVTFASVDNNVSVFAFRQQDGQFLLENTFRDGWETQEDGSLKLPVSLPLGKYKFLFAKSFGDALQLDPQPVKGVNFSDMKFLLQSSSEAGYYNSADELYLQDDPAKAVREYEIYAPEVITCILQRAVSRVDVVIRRGYQDGVDAQGQPNMVEVPYTDPTDNILQYIQGVEIKVTNSGSSVNVSAGTGNVNVFHSMISSQGTLNNDGFAGFEGPYLIPNGEEFNLDVKLLPLPGGGFPTLQKNGFRATLARNKRLIVNLWVDKLWPELIITVKTGPINEEIDGDTGFWEGELNNI